MLLSSWGLCKLIEEACESFLRHGAILCSLVSPALLMLGCQGFAGGVFQAQRLQRAFNESASSMDSVQRA
ncbi:MAG: hypothetical protein CL862_02270 [Cyanobium sp. NAT70]|nr:hypothetical protein [Cyanobium sp. NAT70]